jgi:penicillin-insensitive murein endopeptidase
MSLFSRFATSICLLGAGACASASARLGGPAPAGALPGAPVETALTSAPGDAGPLAQGDAAPLARNAPVSSEDEASGTDDKDEIDDGAEGTAGAAMGRIYKHPLDGWTERQIEDELAKDPESLGSMSIGFTNAGALYNSVRMPEGSAWELVDPDHAWGTRETVDYLAHCLGKVGDQFPGAPMMYIGHISARRGGHLSPHISHQSGRDVDVSYYYLAGESKWYAVARASNLDRERTWAFVKTLVTDTDVELILMDRSVQRLVREFALSRGEDKDWVDQLFDGDGTLPPVIRHAKGHATHLHVRFFNPLAQETGRRAYEALMKRHVIEPPTLFVKHKVKEGDTLIGLAKKFHVTAKAIQQANGMKSDMLRAERDYKIPQRGGVKPGPRPLIPARRIPPPGTSATPATAPPQGRAG